MCFVSLQYQLRSCNGPAIAIDAAGSYCSTVLDANGLCCASALDVCGVCGGDSTSCGSLLSLNLTSPSGPCSSSPAIGSAQYNTIAQVRHCVLLRVHILTRFTLLCHVQSLSQSLPSLLAVPSSSLTLSSLTSANPPVSALTLLSSASLCDVRITQGSLLAGVSVLPSNTSVTAYIPASTPTLPGATVGPYTIASVVSSTPIGGLFPSSFLLIPVCNL